MPSHNFNFDGGEYLAKIGASWFVSYMFYELLDRTHLNWRNVTTSRYRISIFNRTREYHKYWLQQILNMNDKRLSTNTINLKSIQIKTMARKLLMKGGKYD